MTEALLSASERLQTEGQWDAAMFALRRCRDSGVISRADFLLSAAALQERKQCTNAALDFVSGGGSPDDVPGYLLRKGYDEYTVYWVMSSGCI